MSASRLFIIISMFSFIASGCGNSNEPKSDLEQDLIGHWKLETDCRDYSGSKNHGTNSAVRFSPVEEAPAAAIFDGRKSHITVRHDESLNLGTENFTVSVWVHTEKFTDDVLGDILSKFDPAARKGLNFSVMNYPGVTNGQPNHRNVFFGIDDGKIDEKFTDCGRPGNTEYISTLTVYNGDLYASTYESGKNEAGHVYRYEGGTHWVDCGNPDNSNMVASMAVLDGKLYAGTAYYHAQGSALNPSENTTPGGKVYRYEGGKTWVDCGRLGEHKLVYHWVVQGGGPAKDVWALTTFKEHLYGHPLVSEGIWRYDGEQNWAYVGSPGRRMFGIGVYNGTLYGMGNDIGGIVRYDGGMMWENAGYQKDVTQVYSIAIHNGIMYAGAWPTGSVFRDDGNLQWTDVGRLGQEDEVMGMLVYNGKMYAGTLPTAEVYRYDGDSTWTFIDRVDYTPDVKYRRAWTFAVYDGKLYVGSLPSGHVLAIEAGKCVTDDYELAHGWKHLVAMRENDRIKLFIDGELRKTSSSFEPNLLNISNENDLLIGFGTHDYFYGKMRDLRLYKKALDETTVHRLFEASKVK